MPEFQATGRARAESGLFRNKGDYQKVLRTRAEKALEIVEEAKALRREEESSVTVLAGANNKFLRRIKRDAR